MKILSIELQGFRSFRQRERFTLPTAPGLYYLTGENLDEPELEANGSGKSSLWEAVCWCLYGKTPSGLRTTELVAWGNDEMSVTVTLPEAAVTRQWSSSKMNSLTLNGDEIDQQRLDDLLGHTYETFCRSVYFAQFSPAFIDLSAQEKADLLSAVLDLDVWAQRKERAQDKAKALRKDLEAEQQKVARAQGALQEIEKQCDLAGIEYAQLEDVLFDAKHVLDRAEAVHRDAAAVMAAKAVPYGNMVAAMQDFNSRVSDAREAHVVARGRAESINAELGGLDRRLAKLRKDQSAHLGNRTCEACGQKLDARSIATHMTAMAEGIKDLERQVRTKEAALDKAYGDEVDALQHLELLQVGAPDFTTERLEYDQAMEAEREALTTLLEARSDHKQLLSRRTQLEALHEVQRQQLEDNVHYIAAHEEWVDEIASQVKQAEWWVQGFMDIRLSLISEALAALEAHANSSLVSMGLAAWEITFAVDSETKAGKVKRGFSVMIKSPTSPTRVPWAAWSGGEAQRLRMAVSLGLATLIEQHLGAESFVEVWDEPTNAMSAKGIDDLLATLAYRAETFGRQVWLIDHRALGSGEFTQTFKVRKHHGTSKIEVA